MAKTTKKSTKTASKRVANKSTQKTKGASFERGYGIFSVPNITAKNLKSAEVKEFNLRDFVLGCLAANPELTNEELMTLVHKSGRDNSALTVGWYAARVRQGHIKKGK